MITEIMHVKRVSLEPVLGMIRDRQIRMQTALKQFEIKLQSN